MSISKIAQVAIILACVSCAYSVWNYYTSILPEQKKVELRDKEFEKEDIRKHYELCTDNADSAFNSAVLNWCPPEMKSLGCKPMSDHEFQEARRDSETAKDRCLAEFKAGIY